MKVKAIHAASNFSQTSISTLILGVRVPSFDCWCGSVSLWCCLFHLDFSKEAIELTILSFFWLLYLLFIVKFHCFSLGADEFESVLVGSKWFVSDDVTGDLVIISFSHYPFSLSVWYKGFDHSFSSFQAVELSFTNFLWLVGLQQRIPLLRFWCIDGS